MCCWVAKTTWKNILRVLESSGKLLEFRMSNTVGTLHCIVQNSLSSVDGLIKKHDGFTTTLEAQREKITTLEQLCQALLAQDHYASEQIKSRCDGVVDRMSRVLQTTESRRLKLLESRSYQQFLCNIYEVQCASVSVSHNRSKIWQKMLINEVGLLLLLRLAPL